MKYESAHESNTDVTATDQSPGGSERGRGEDEDGRL